MRKYIKKGATRLAAQTLWQIPLARLTPQEKKSLLFIAGLFILGAAVRWYRIAHAP